MSFPHLIIQLIRELEEDIVISNPKETGRAYLRKLVYRWTYWLDRGLGRWRPKGRRRR